MSAKLAPPAPQAIVIFGASGDLARRKLLPALYHLFVSGMLPEAFAVVGFARREIPDFARYAREAVTEFGRRPPEDDAWSAFAGALSYVRGSFDDPAAIGTLREHLRAVDRDRGTEGSRFLYCSTPPEAYEPLVEELIRTPLGDRSRIVIEKPFGTDLESARELNRTLHRAFDESQIFRIDHYLGKETVQNILVLRFANTLFEPVWDRRYVDHVQLTVAEDIGIEGRGRFYERTGALRDMVQTHLFQVLCFLAMEPPVAFEPETLRDESAKVLRSMRVCAREHVVRGQYAGYRGEPDVGGDSNVETFAALRLEIDSWRWAGVPFFLRTGKRLPRKMTEATVVFRPAPLTLFEHDGIEEIPSNLLRIRIQPNEGISIAFHVQRPGLGIALDDAALEFDFGESYAGMPLVEAYEQLLFEAMHGDHTLFTRQDAVERAWEVLQRAFDDPPPVRAYEPGTWGPAEAEALIAPRSWLG